MSYATKKESAKLKAMERLCRKLSYDKEGNDINTKVELKITSGGKVLAGTFYAITILEILEYYNTAD